MSDPASATVTRRSPAPSPLPAGLRIYAVGDVHGRFDLLQEMVPE